MKKPLAVGATVVIALVAALGATACESTTDGSFSVAQKLSAIDTGGDTEAEAAEFQRILDCIRASGIEGGETETQIADTLVAGWKAAGGENGDGQLLLFAQALC